MMARMRRSIRWLTAAVLVAILSAGCSVRWETPPPQWPSPAPTTVERDRAAQAESDVVDAAADSSALAQWQTATAPVRLDAWGGVYRAYPTPTPSPYAGDLLTATASARNVALDIAETTTDSDQRSLAISSALAHSVALWWSRAELALMEDATWDDVRVALFDGDEWRSAPLTPPDVESMSLALAQLALSADYAAYLYEVAAARSPLEERGWFYERRGELLDAADLWQGLSTSPDLRERVYAVDTTTVSPPAARATLRAAELTMALDAAALAIEHPDHHRWLLSIAMEHFQVALATLDGTWADIPALPGLDVEALQSAEP